MKSFVRTHGRTLLVFLLLFAVLLANAFHEKYPDEFDSIVGGRYITEGRLPYRDWFQHHQPGAYVLASAILAHSGPSFVKFRIGWSIVLFLLFVTSYVMLRQRVRGGNPTFYPVLLIVLAFAGTYFWGHMLLADTLAGYLLLPAFALITLKEFSRERFDRTDLALAGTFAFLSWFTSMTYVFVIAAVSVYALYLFMRSEDSGKPPVRFFAGIFILALPYVLFFLYLVATGSLADYYWANVVYNTNYYIYNYPHAPGQPINPVRYAAVIFDRFLNNYMPALWGVTGLPVSNPVQVTVAFSWAALVGIAVATGRIAFAVMLISVMVFSNARSSPQTVRETDYQAFVYVITGMFAGLFSLSVLRDMLDRQGVAWSRRVLSGLAFALLSVFWIATPLFFVMKFEQKFFPKYMGAAPVIYDRPQIAPYVNAITGPGEFAYVGPFEFEELLYLSARQPSKYHWFLDHAAKSKIKDELIADLTRNRPMVIVFQRDYAPWGGDPKTYNWWMTEFLDANYFRIFTLNSDTGEKYRWKLSKTQNFDIDGTFNFDNARRKEILEKLVALGYVESVTGE